MSPSGFTQAHVTQPKPQAQAQAVGVVGHSVIRVGHCFGGGVGVGGGGGRNSGALFLPALGHLPSDLRLAIQHYGWPASIMQKTCNRHRRRKSAP